MEAFEVLGIPCRYIPVLYAGNNVHPPRIFVHHVGVCLKDQTYESLKALKNRTFPRPPLEGLKYGAFVIPSGELEMVYLTYKGDRKNHYEVAWSIICQVMQAEASISMY